MVEPLCHSDPYDPVSAPLTESILTNTFRILREEVVDNYFMNKDTIALQTNEGFLDTSVFKIKPRCEIDESTDLWMVPTIWPGSGGVETKNFEGEIGLQTYPEL